MGVAQSFLAVKGRAAPDIHRALGLTDTGIVSPEYAYPRPEVRGVALPDGWYLVLLRDVAHRFIASDEILTRLSQGCEVVGSQVEEHAMYSGAFGFIDGEFRWQVVHDPDEGAHHLDVTGEPPAAFVTIAERERARQQAEDDKQRQQPTLMPVDFIWEIPIGLAASLCGYSHDVAFPGGEPVYTILEEGPDG